MISGVAFNANTTSLKYKGHKEDVMTALNDQVPDYYVRRDVEVFVGGFWHHFNDSLRVFAFESSVAG